jgi:hypothetical protein
MLKFSGIIAIYISLYMDPNVSRWSRKKSEDEMLFLKGVSAYRNTNDNTEKQKVTDTNTTINKKLWEELLDYFPLIRHGPHRKRRLQQFFVAAGTSVPNCNLANTHRPTDTRVQQFLYCCACSLPWEGIYRAVA